MRGGIFGGGRAGRAKATITNVRDATTVDAESGAVRSVQSADMRLGVESLERLFSPLQLERLARTYWRFLARITLGLVHVHYTERERFVVLIARPLKLLTFSAPEYELDGSRALVRWRWIQRGLLVAAAGRGGRGHLQIELCRDPAASAGGADRAAGASSIASVHVRVEVAGSTPRSPRGSAPGCTTRPSRASTSW